MNKIIFKLFIALISLNLFTGWTFPVPGVNFPAFDTPNTSRAHLDLMNNRCHAGKTVDCRGVSTSSPGVLLVSYQASVGVGAIPNPHFIAGYADLLRQDCKSGGAQACQYYDIQMAHLAGAKASPRSGLDIWPVYNGMADAMVQAEIADLYLQEHNYAAMARAGMAFDWSWSKGGVAHGYNSNEYWYMAVGVGEPDRRNQLNVHNKALIIIFDMIGTMKRSDFYVSASEIQKWELRLSRGVTALLNRVNTFNNGASWSWARTVPFNVNATNHYHRLNYDTLQRLINRRLDQGNVLLTACTRWKKAATNGQACTPKL